jgi:hypothetical protein
MYTRHTGEWMITSRLHGNAHEGKKHDGTSNAYGDADPTWANDAVYEFRRYEDSSLSYTGINKHEGEDVGLFDTVLTAEDYQAIFENQAATK